MVRLTAALISAIQDGADITSIESLIVPRRDLDQLVGLDVCEKLVRLDLSNNRLSTVEGITLCTRLQWLSLAGNQLTSLKGIENLKKLTVFNASRNRLRSMTEVAALTNLRALILNDNEIATICRLDHLVDLNTIVLSRNPIRNLGNFGSKLTSLKKLSLSNCQVQVLGTSLRRCVALEELRLAHNRLSSFPQELENNGRLSIIDVGSNNFTTWPDLQVLESLHRLVNLNLQGNPLCAGSDYKEQISERFPHLKIVDGRPLQSGKSRGKKTNKNDTTGQGEGGLGPDKQAILDETDLDDPTISKPLSKRSKTTAGEKQARSTSKSNSEALKETELETEDRSFLELIAAAEGPGSLTSAVDSTPGNGKTSKKSKKRKDDSGVVSVVDSTKGARAGVVKARKVEEILGEESGIGSGGASTWDDPPVSTEAHDNKQGSKNAGSENKHYSRWALKKQ